MKKTKPKVKTYTPHDPTWERAANRLARDFCPGIYPCNRCGYPVVHGYCCTNCGSSDPSNPEQDDE